MSPRRFQSPMPDPDGLLLVSKPRGMTSHDVVDAVRRHFQLNKVGHGGTLDPMATGLLILLIGRGTKLADRVINADKEYVGVFHLGVETDSEDADGTIIAQHDIGHVDEAAVRAAMAKRIGDQLQVPPMLSAKKVGGRPLYRLARRGQTVEREPRLIHVYEFSLLRFDPPRVQFRLRCTKGTYVRTLCAAIGRELGCGAFLEELERTASGNLRSDQAIPLDQILQWTRAELESHLLPLTALPAST